ncbi:MAG TPA: hypothetical protein VKU01_33660 [Bryobacteraceae bacterium]|nr:hypothetical protein [Bryobacteraceae bacterium]
MLALFAVVVLTAQYDNARTGATLTETALTPANVNSSKFGKLFSLPVDGDVYAQPLYLPHIEMPGKGTHNVLFVATEHDSVYAFDADGSSSEPLWRVNFLTDGATTVRAQDVRCPFILPEIGITPTPVIDYPSGTIYVLARTKEDGRYVHRLHALAITTGAEKFGGPVEIKTPGFNGLRELPRAALLLAKGQVYLTWGSSCDVGPYHGWVMAYDAHKLTQTAVLNTSPDSEESGIWQSDNGPAADDDGNVYVATGNGKFTLASNGHDYGDSLLKLGLASSGLKVLDYFTPPNEQLLNKEDDDLGSGGPVVLPRAKGDKRQLVLVGGKDGRLYALDRDHLGKLGDANPVFKFRGGIYAAPAYWNGRVYVLASGDYLSAFAVTNGALSDHPVSIGGERFGNPGATPAISANGDKDGVVWLIDTKAWNGRDRPALLHAYDASDVSREIYNTEQNSARDHLGLCLRFTIPTVANGKVYVETKKQIEVYGRLR